MMNSFPQWILAVVAGLGSAFAAPALAESGPAAGVAVVELFTSEGCSSCPPADAALAELIRQNAGGRVYALAFHVDYWDDLGWPDAFGRPEFTQRQRDYAHAFKLDSVYTPQAVVNGQAEFVGSNRGKLRDAVAAALKVPVAGTLTVTATRADAVAKVDVVAAGLPAGTVLRAAMVQAGITSKVARGENGGKVLSHENVVRAFASATLTDQPKVSLSLSAPSTGWPKDGSIIVFAQRSADGHVVAASEVKLPQ